MTTADPRSAVATHRYVEDAARLSTAARNAFSERGQAVILGAQDEARLRDDDHCGTEHVILALWRHAPNTAGDALSSVGVTAEVFQAQLHDEPGPSPEGVIPYTPRAMMIGGLALEEARRFGSEWIEPEHILLGAIREGERWASEKMGGPQHLRSALAAVGASPEALEAVVLDLMRGR